MCCDSDCGSKKLSREISIETNWIPSAAGKDRLNSRALMGGFMKLGAHKLQLGNPLIRLDWLIRVIFSF